MLHDSHSTVRLSRPATPADVPVSTAIGRFLGLLAEWQDRAERRRSHEPLSAHLMRDIGLTPADVARLALKS